MIQIYDYIEFYDEKVEVKIDNEVDLIQFLDYLKLLNPKEQNYYEHFDDWTPYYPLYMRVYEGHSSKTYEWTFEYEPSEGYTTISYDGIIINQDLNIRIENEKLRNKAQSMERHALEAVEEWCNIKEVEKRAISKVADISRKYGYTSTLAEIDKCTLNGANDIFNIFWQELEAKLEGDAELLAWYDDEYSRP
jgi:hypothetical protein